MGEYYFPLFGDLSRLDREDLIIQILEEVIIPNMPEHESKWLDLVSCGYHKAKRYKDSIEWGEKLLSLTSNNNNIDEKFAIRANLIKNYININDPISAKKHVGLNLRFFPNNIDMKMYLSVCYYMMNEKEKSKEILLQLNSLDLPTNLAETVKYNLGIHYIKDDNFNEGMRCLHYGRKKKIFGNGDKTLSVPLWDGKSYPGKSIIVLGEGGIGDEIINSRFIKNIKEIGMSPHIASIHGNSTVFSRMGYHSSVDYKRNAYNEIENINEYDFYVNMMDLPYVLNLNKEDLWHGPYLTIDKTYKEKWKNILPKNDKIKIGLKWSGNPLYDHDLHRTIPIKDILPMFDLNKYELVSLQKENYNEIENNSNIINLSSELTDIEDLIAAIDSCDIIISSCTSVAHIAGALDKKTFVFVPIMNYYIWAEDKEHSSWYSDNLSILRQTNTGSWELPISQLYEKLSQIR